MHPILKIAGFCVAFGSLAHMAEPASAKTDESRITGQVRVEYRRGELMDEAGARQLFRRLSQAAGKACSEGAAKRFGRDYRDCRDQALANAVKEIGSPTLTAVWSPPKPTRLARR